MSSRLQKNEINRKLVHLSSLWMPVAIYALNKPQAILIFGGATLLVLAAEFFRFRSAPFANFFDSVLSDTLRAGEKTRAGRITGASYMMLGVFASLFFPKEIAITATSVLMVSDTAAALVGQRYGRLRFMGKSLEGAVAFLISGLCVVMVLSAVMPHAQGYVLAGIVGVVAAMVAELFSRDLFLNDNFTIPVFLSLAMWGVQ